MIPEMPPVQSMEAVDLHLRLIVEQLREIRARQEQMVTKAELLSTIESLKREISDNSIRTGWRRLTEVAVGVVAMCTAVGFAVALFRFLKV
jgi:hypothetical protein